MTVRELIDQLVALGTPDAEVYGVSSPYPEDRYWPITGMIHCATVVELTGENNE